MITAAELEDRIIRRGKYLSDDEWLQTRNDIQDLLTNKDISAEEYKKIKSLGLDYVVSMLCDGIIRRHEINSRTSKSK
ncbi:hypothetical protein SAMN05216390_102383 [Lachnospiraceae bacterium KH1T2]|nr:hypothetical protein SAMN05216390_102383 [Lachnospiraceae bacterium KH1T2]